MAKRIAWSQHEVALLFRAYEEFAAGAGLNRVAEDLSKTLRTMALRAGQEIDETYRNVNGMKMQLWDVQYLFTNGQMGLSGASALIRQMYEIYIQRPAEYRKILEEALSVVDQMKSIDDAFFKWLAARVSTSQLSDYYAAMSDANEYCVSNKLISGSIFTLDDPSVVEQIESSRQFSRVFRHYSHKQGKLMSSGLRYYAQFLKERQQSSITPEKVEKPRQQGNGVTSYSIEERYVAYLRSKGHNAISINENLRALQKSEKIARDMDISGNSLYNAEDHADALAVFSKLLSEHRFVEDNRKARGQHVIAVQKYLEMLKTGIAANQSKEASEPQASDMQKGKAVAEIKTQPIEEAPKDIVRLLELKRLLYVDKRQQGGVLWLIGGMEHADFILQARNNGYTFRYCPGGGRSTGNKTAWYLVEDETESATRAKSDREISIPKSDERITRQITKAEAQAPSVKTLALDLQNRLAGVEYAPLRSILLREGILTIDQFNALDLWDFMNRHNIYHKDLRARMYRRLSETGKPLGVPSVIKEHTITVAENSYTGATPAQAFLLFCDSYVRKYPAEMRKLVNAPYQGDQPVVLHQWDSSGKMLRLTGINAFIDSEMKAEDADKYAIWICNRCKELSSTANVVAPAIVAVKSNRKDDETTKGEKTNDSKEASPSEVDSHSGLNESGEEKDHDNSGDAEPSARLASGLSEERLQDICLTDLSKSNDFSFCQFDFLEIEGVRYSAASSWRGAYIWTMNQLLRTHPEAFRLVLEKQRGLRDNTGATCVLEDGSVICVQYSATELMRRLVGAIAICGIPVRSVIVGYRPMKERSGQYEEQYEQKAVSKTDLSAKNNFAFCKPVYCDYDGETLQNAKFWQRVYLWLLNYLSEKFQTRFEAALRAAFKKQGRIRAPGYLDNGTVVEINLSATDLMRKATMVAQGCGVNPKDIVIGYIPREDDGKEIELTPPEPVSGVQITISDKGVMPITLDNPDKLIKGFEDWLVNDRKLSRTVGKIYRQALSSADRILRDGDSSFSLLTERPEIIRECFSRLKLSGDYSHARISQYRSAIQYYALFREQNAPAGTTDTPASNNTGVSSQTQTEQPQQQVDDRWQRVLKEGFPDGYIPGDFICQMQADAQWQEIYGSPCPLSGDGIDAAFAAIGVRRDDRIYARDEDTSALLDDICAEIDGILATYTCVYPSRIYEKYEKALAEQSVYSLDAMIEALAGHANGRFEQRYKLYVKPGYTARQSEDCRKVMRARGGETTREELCEALWFISEDGVNAGINACPDIIRIGVGRWLLAEHFPIDAEDVQNIGDVIMRELEVKPMVRSNEIKGLLQRELPGMADDLAPYENVALINLLRYHLSDRFSFTATIITARGEKININDQFETFARERDRFTLGELEAVANENGTGIYWETVLQEAVRINQEELVNRSNIHFDVDAIDAVLDEFCPGKYEGLKQLPDALLFHLPTCGYPWNKYLLYSYLFAFSKRFMLCYRSLSKSGYFGAIVRRGCGIEEYKDLVEQILINSDGWTTTADALQLLVDGGYQEYYRYKRIDAIVARVKDRRI